MVNAAKTKAKTKTTAKRKIADIFIKEVNEFKFLERVEKGSKRRAQK